MEGMTQSMSHAPFIIASYAVAAILLAWGALAPRLKKNSALRNIRRLIKIEDQNRDSNT
jgi:heme exporter protein CcmD